MRNTVPGAIFKDIPILKSENVPECPGCGGTETFVVQPASGPGLAGCLACGKQWKLAQACGAGCPAKSGEFFIENDSVAQVDELNGEVTSPERPGAKFSPGSKRYVRPLGLSKERRAELEVEAERLQVELLRNGDKMDSNTRERTETELRRVEARLRFNR